MQLTAQRLVLDLMSAAGDVEMPVRALVGAAEVFGITQNSLRVALARLLADGKVTRNLRGLYALSAAAEPVQRHVASWSTIEERLVPWQGGWVAVHTAGLRRSSRAVVRRRERALEFLGMRRLSPGLWLRPDNLAGGACQVRDELATLGMEPKAPVFAMTELSHTTDARARRLWNAKTIERTYRDMTDKIAMSERGLDRLPLEQAVVECFLLGGRAIRQLAYDPLLPEPIVATCLRSELVAAMRRYDRAGRRVWQKFMREHDAPALESLLSFRNVESAA